MVAAMSGGRTWRWSVRALTAAVIAAGALCLTSAPDDAAAKKRPARADLTVRSAGAGLQAGRVNVSLVAANTGRRKAPASSAMVSWKPVGSPVVTVLKRFQVPALRARTRRTVRVAIAVPAGASGAFTVSVCLNARGTVRETSRGNNCRSAGRVTVPAAGALGEVRTSTPPPASPAAPAPAPPVGGGGTPPGGGSGGPDTTPPDTTIGRGPVGTTNTRAETFMFSASEAGATFECRLDAGPWAACVSPKALTLLPDGLRTFEVRARDAAGNVDPTPATRSWTVDGGPPETAITAGPAPQVNTTSASLEFAASDPGASFQCKFDGAAAWTFCTSPFERTGLAVGTHTLLVRAIDGAGNIDPTPASRSWTIDLTPPQTTIVSGPASGETTGPGVAFGFAAEAGATFECRLDDGSWAACASPASYANLPDGAHTFEVRAIDAAGNPDASPAQRSWTVDATAPETTIDGGPSGPVASRDAAFTFSAPGAGVTFECRLDGGSWSACSSPKGYAALADGSHTFEVRGVDALGNADATPAQRTWSIDATAPQTTLDGGPSGSVASTDASLTFSSEAGATFECRLDGGSWSACSSPQAYAGLAEGPHTFEVRAVDALGNADVTPAQRTWTVDTTAPETAIDTGPSGTVATSSASLTFSSEAGATFECRMNGGTWLPCPSPKSYAKLADGFHTFEVRAVDAAGNIDATPAQRTWTVDTTAPETAIDTGPSGTVASPDATFTFSSPDGGATFTCRLDGGAWAPCASPLTFTGLADGPHTLEVVASDAVGNADATPATQTWTVAAVPAP